MDRYIPLSVPNLKGNELLYVTQAIEQEWVSTAGHFVNKFEEDMANYLKVQATTALQSGTAGIHLALQLCNVERDDEVIVPTLTFIAAVNPVKYLGASPIFMDCDNSLCMDMDKLNDFCETQCKMVDGQLINNLTNRKIKAVIIVHVFGNMADMEQATIICKKYNIKLIEDATEALGTYYQDGVFKGKYAGTIGDIGVYSFNGNKIITTGGGGMLVAKNTDMVKRAKYLSTQAKDDEINFIHNEIGYNYRMTNVQAAIGVAQLEQLENFINIKAKNYFLIREKGLKLLEFKDNIRPNYWFYSLLASGHKNKLIEYFSSNQIQVRPIWGLINMQYPYVDEQIYKIEKAIYYHENIINIPCSSNLGTLEIDRLTQIYNNFIGGN